METRFTPGPWTVGAPSGHNANYVFAGDDSVASVFGLPMHTSLEDIPIGARWENGLANALIIAAAPALYEALTRALGIIVEMGNLNGFHALTDEQLGRAVIEVAQQCSDALALARGETSQPEHCGGMETSAESGEPGDK